MEAFNYLQSEWQVLREAPVVFIGVAIIAFLLGAGTMRRMLGERLALWQERARTRDETIADLQQRLGALPETARNSFPRRLTNEQKCRIADALREHVARLRIEVMYFSNEECADFAADIVDALRLGGANAVLSSYLFGGPSPEDRDLLLRVRQGADEVLVDRVQTALKAVSGVPCRLFRTNRTMESGGDPFNIEVNRPG